MKKLFTLLCTLAILLSVSAAPRALKKSGTLQKTRIAAKAPIRPKADKAAAKFVSAKALKQKTAKFNPNRRIAKAPLAKLETMNVKIVGVLAEYDEEESLFTYMMAGDNDIYFFFSFPSEGEDVVENGKTYTIEDMDANNTYWYASMFEYDDFESCSFTKTVNEGKVKIEVSATDTYGDEWNLLYDEASLPVLPNGGSLVADYVGFAFYEAEEEGMPNDVYYALDFPDLNLQFQFDIYVEDGMKDVESGKTYTLEDMWAKYSNIVVGKVNQISFKTVSFTKTLSEDGSYTVVVVAEDENGNIWNVSASKEAPKITNETLTLNGIAEENYFQIIEAANEDSSVVVTAIIFAKSFEGEFTEDNIYSGTVLFNGIEYEMTEAAITIAYSKDEEAYIATGTMNTVNPDDELDIVIFTLNLKLAGEAPEEFVPSDMTFTFQVTDSSVIVIPSNNEDPWDYFFISPDKLVSDYGNDLDSLAQVIYDRYGDEYAKPGKFEFPFTALQMPEGEQILVVWGAHVGVTTPADSVHFIMPEKEVIPVDMTFSFQNDGTGIIVTPSNNEDPWDWYILKAADFAEQWNNDADAIANAAYAKWEDTYAEPGETKISFSVMLANDYEVGEYVIVVWGCNGGVTTPAAVYAFGLWAEGIDNTEVEGKAVKLIRDGQLIILRNGVEFNAQGIRY